MSTKLSRLDKALYRSLFKQAKILDLNPLLRIAVFSDSSTSWSGYQVPENISKGPFFEQLGQHEPGSNRGLSFIRAFAMGNSPPAQSQEIQKDISTTSLKDEEDFLTRQQWYVPPASMKSKRLHSAIEFLRRSFRRQFDSTFSTLEKQPQHQTPTFVLVEDQSAAFFVLRYLTDRLSVGKHLGFDVKSPSELDEYNEILTTKLSPMLAPAMRTNTISPGTLLLSHPFLDTPFDRKVILILEHDPIRGTIGVIINPETQTGTVETMTSAFMTPVVRSSALMTHANVTTSANISKDPTTNLSFNDDPSSPSSFPSSSPMPQLPRKTPSGPQTGGRKRQSSRNDTNSTTSLSSLTPRKLRQLLKEVEEEIESDAISGAIAQQDAFSSIHQQDGHSSKSLKINTIRKTHTFSDNPITSFWKSIRRKGLYRLAPNSPGEKNFRQGSTNTLLNDTSIDRFDASFHVSDNKSFSQSSSSFHFSEAEAIVTTLSPNRGSTVGRNRERSLRRGGYSHTSQLVDNLNVNDTSSPAPKNAILESIFSKASVLARAGTAQVLLGRLRGAGIPAEKISAHSIVAASVPGETSSLGISLLPLGPGLDMPSTIQGRKEQAEFNLKSWTPIVHLPVALVDLSSGATYGGNEHLEEELRGTAGLNNDDILSSDDDDDEETDSDNDDSNTVSSNQSSASARGMKTKGKDQGITQEKDVHSSLNKDEMSRIESISKSSLSTLASLSTEEINALVASATDALAKEVASLDIKGKYKESEEFEEFDKSIERVHTATETARLLRKFEKIVRSKTTTEKTNAFDNNLETTEMESELLTLPLHRRRRFNRLGKKRLQDESSLSLSSSLSSIKKQHSLSLSTSSSTTLSSTSSTSSKSNVKGNTGSRKRGDGSEEIYSEPLIQSKASIPSNSSLSDVLKIFGDKKVMNGGPVQGYYLVLHPYDFLGRYVIHPKTDSVTDSDPTPIESSSLHPPIQKPFFVLRDVRDAAKFAISLETSRLTPVPHRQSRRRVSSGVTQIKQTMTSSAFTFFAGASRWHQGQLEEEIKEGTWILVNHPQIANLVVANDRGNKDSVLGSSMWNQLIYSLGGEFKFWAAAPLHPNR